MTALSRVTLASAGLSCCTCVNTKHTSDAVGDIVMVTLLSVMLVVICSICSGGDLCHCFRYKCCPLPEISFIISKCHPDRGTAEAIRSN